MASATGGTRLYPASTEDDGSVRVSIPVVLSLRPLGRRIMEPLDSVLTELGSRPRFMFSSWDYRIAPADAVVERWSIYGSIDRVTGRGPLRDTKCPLGHGR